MQRENRSKLKKINIVEILIAQKSTVIIQRIILEYHRNVDDF
jgi:hypothetical protein